MVNPAFLKNEAVYTALANIAVFVYLGMNILNGMFPGDWLMILILSGGSIASILFILKRMAKDR